MSRLFERAVAASNRMGLVDIAETMTPIAELAAEEGWSYERFACELLEEQARRAEVRSQETLLRFASFPFKRTLDDFDFSFQPSASEKMFRELAECGFIRESSNIILLGPPGTGKTHLAVALGIEATKRRYRVKFTTCAALTTRLREARERNTYSRNLSAFARPSLLIIDEVGFKPLNQEEASMLFDVICRRYEHGSIILTSNKSYSEWGEILSDNQALATAVLDRLLHHSKSVVLKGGSYRMKEHKESE